MKFKPHNYQQYAVSYIENHPACFLVLGMGLGKTAITLTALNNLILDHFEIEKVLIIAPKRVAADTWPKEIAKWDHLSQLSFSLVLGTEKQRITALNTPALLYIINRENVGWLVEFYRAQKKWPFDTVVIDESSSFKSQKSQRFKALKKVCPARVKRIIALTGTPAPNNLLELWPQVFLLDGGQRLGRFSAHFRRRYFRPDKQNGYQVFSYKLKEGAEKQIYALISDITLSMKAIDYLPMPKLIENIVEVQLSPKEIKLYKQFKKDLVLELNGAELDANNAAVLSNKLMQMANGAVYDTNQVPLEIHSRKLEALEDLIEAANGQPLLVVYWYKHDLTRLQKRFPDGRRLDTSLDFAAWNAGKISLAFIHPASAGHGLNLQEGGSIIVWFGLNWSLELYQQTNARLWRQGQKQSVVIYHLVAKGTLDESVIQALKTKNTQQAALIEAVKAQLS